MSRKPSCGPDHRDRGSSFPTDRRFTLPLAYLAILCVLCARCLVGLIRSVQRPYLQVKVALARRCAPMVKPMKAAVAFAGTSSRSTSSACTVTM